MKKYFIVFCMFLIGNFGFCFDVYKLNNGQTVIIEEIHTNPIVTIDTWIKTGSINETDKNNGVSHFLEHLFFKGTDTYKTGEFDKILEAKGAVNNAATSKDFTHYYITIPSNEFDLALKLHADMLQRPAIPSDELEKERLVVLEEISKDINSPTTKIYNNLTEMLYTTHPYKRKVIGESDIIKNITRDEILEYFNKYYAPSNMITIIVGDVNSREVLNKISKEFTCKSKRTPNNTYIKEKQLKTLCRKIEYMQTQSGYMLIGFRGVKITDKDAYALDVLSTILGDGKSSILYQNIKDKRQLAFSISTQNGTFKDDGVFYISANFTPEKYQQLEENIFLEIAKLQKNGVSEEQLELAKNIIETDTYYSRESVSSIAQEIGYTTVTSGSTKLYDNYLTNIKKVTAKDVQKVANKYLKINNAAISVIIPEQFKEKPVSQKKPINKAANFISENCITQKYKLANNGVLLYTPNKSNDIVGINIQFKGGEFIEKIAGTGSLTASLIMRGTKNYTSKEFSDILENNGIKIIPSSKADSFSINILTTKAKLDKTFELLNEVVNNALLSDDELSKLKAEKINSIKKNRDLPMQRALEEHNSNIYFGSVYSNSTKILEKTYPIITQKDIAQYYDKIFDSNQMTVSVCGNVDKDEIIKEMTNIFSLKSSEEFDYSKYSIPMVKSSRISILTDKKTETDWIVLAWQTDGITNIKDYAVLSVIDSILGTGMSSRLFVNLRDKEGLAYQIGSSYNPKIKKGSFVVYMGTNPKSYERSKSKLFEEVYRLKKEQVNEDELQAAKDKLIGNFVISQETNLDKASTLGWFELCNLGYNYDFIKAVEKVTKKDIIEVANKYFNNNYVLSVVKK